MELKDRIRALRLQKGISQEELAKLVGLKKAAINKYETGIVVNPKRPLIEAFAKALDTTPSYLMGWEEEEEKVSVNGVFSKNLIFLRTKHNLSQEEVAEKLKKSVNLIKQWEKGKSEPTISIVHDLAILFHVSMDELYNVDISDIDQKFENNTIAAHHDGEWTEEQIQFLEELVAKAKKQKGL